MSWICDNESDFAVLEAQKEIRRLHSVIREMKEEQENTLPKRAVWKDKKVIGYIHLTDEQSEELNSLKDIGIYIGFDKVTNPQAYINEFEYNGYHFAPVKKLDEKENFRSISSKIYSERTLAMANYDFKWVKVPWDYKAFYEASTDKEADIFRCSETNLLYLPGENELFGWKE